MTTITLSILATLLLITILSIAILHIRRESTRTPPPRATVRRVPARRRAITTPLPFLPYVQPQRALEPVLEALEWQWDIVEDELEEVFTQPAIWATLFVIPQQEAIIVCDNPTTPLTLSMLGIIRCKRRDIGRKPVRDLPYVDYPMVDCSPFLLATTYPPVDVQGWLERVIGPTVELEIEPCQLDMAQEVQLRAIMPIDEPQCSVRAIEPDIEGIDATLIQAGENDRTAFEPVELRELADNIAAHGLAQPITVRPIQNGRYEIVAGERRFRAMTECLGWTTIPKNYILVRTLTNEQAAAIMLSENLMRSDLNPIDEASAYDKRMKQFGWSVSGIADHAKVPVSRVKSRLALLSLTTDAQTLIKSGNISVGYGELMADLDANNQALALQYFNTAKRPSIAEFRELCGKLLADQAQWAMFDMDSFMQESASAYSAELQQRKARRFPVSETLPAMPKASSVATALENYIATLMQSEQMDVRDAAGIVGKVYQGLLEQGLTKRPKESMLDTLTHTEVELELVAA